MDYTQVINIMIPLILLALVVQLVVSFLPKKKRASEEEENYSVLLSKTANERIYYMLLRASKANIEPKTKKEFWVTGGRAWKPRKIGDIVGIVPLHMEIAFFVRRGKKSKPILIFVEPELVSDLNTSRVFVDALGIVTYDGLFFYPEVPEKRAEHYTDFVQRRLYNHGLRTLLMLSSDMNNDMERSMKKALRGSAIIEEALPIVPEVPEEEIEQALKRRRMESLGGAEDRQRELMRRYFIMRYGVPPEVFQAHYKRKYYEKPYANVPPEMFQGGGLI